MALKLLSDSFIDRVYLADRHILANHMGLAVQVVTFYRKFTGKAYPAGQSQWFRPAMTLMPLQEADFGTGL